MTLNSESSCIMKCASDLRHVFIPFMVYSTELTVWAVLIRKGVVTYEWSSWRVGLLVIAPWLILLCCSLIWAFIDMSMARMNVDLFLAGTILSAVAQAVFILVLHQKN